MGATITEDKDPDSILFGIGNLALMAYVAGVLASPLVLVDTGILSAAELTYNRAVQSFKAGGTKWKTLVSDDDLTFQATYAEVSIANLQRAIQGTTSGSPDPTTIKFGGHRNLDPYYARFEHTRSDGLIVTFDMYKGVASGEFKLGFGDQFITYPTTFEANADANKPVGQRYGLIKIAA